MRYLVRSIKKFNEDDMAVYAAALSYQLLFSIFPFMIFLLALLGLLNITEIFDWLLKQAQTILPGMASELVKNIVGQIGSFAAEPVVLSPLAPSLAFGRPPQRLG